MDITHEHQCETQGEPRSRSLPGQIDICSQAEKVKEGQKRSDIHGEMQDETCDPHKGCAQQPVFSQKQERIIKKVAIAELHNTEKENARDKIVCENQKIVG